MKILQCLLTVFNEGRLNIVKTNVKRQTAKSYQIRKKNLDFCATKVCTKKSVQRTVFV